MYLKQHDNCDMMKKYEIIFPMSNAISYWVSWHFLYCLFRKTTGKTNALSSSCFLRKNIFMFFIYQVVKVINT